MEAEQSPRRRADDVRITELHAGLEHLHDCIEAVKSELKKNTEVTEQVRDILATFKVVGAIAKWIGIVLGAAAACAHGWQRLTGRG